MALDNNSGEIISLEEAKIYIEAFKRKYPNEVKGFFVGSNNVQLILQQQDCIGIRIYNGYDEIAARMNQVLVGVDIYEKDMAHGVIIEKTITCPNNCDNNSPLIV